MTTFEPDGNHVAVILHRIAVELEQRGIGIDQGDVLPAVAIVVEESETTAVANVVQTGNARHVTERLARTVHEQFVALIATERMRDVATIAHFATGQAAVDIWGQCGTALASFPFVGKAETLAGDALIRAHERAPEITSQVDFRGDLLRRGEVTVDRVDIQPAVVVEIGELPTPAPACFGDLHRWRLQA